MRRVGESLRRLKVVGFAAATLLIALTSTVEARPGHSASVEIRPPNTSAFADLGRHGGYRIGLSMPNDQVVILSVIRYEVKRDKGALFANTYVAHSRQSLRRGVIRARLGSLGSFSLRFRPSGRVRDLGSQRGCEGGPSITEYGRFMGRATFRGEDHYLHFSLSGGSGGITRSPRLRCEKGEVFDPVHGSLRAYAAPRSFFVTQGDIALLYVTRHSPGRYIGITAGHEEESPPGAEVRIGILESRKEMAIGRYALVLNAPGTLLTSLPGVHPATATLAPRAPFFGEATYQEEPMDSLSWSGKLGVSLPGLKLPLTGPGFHARLCVLSPLKTRSGCDFFKAEPVFDERAARPGLFR
jgi:hypothetical protein